jgi:hypothetical protein
MQIIIGESNVSPRLKATEFQLERWYRGTADNLLYYCQTKQFVIRFGYGELSVSPAELCPGFFIEVPTPESITIKM